MRNPVASNKLKFDGTRKPPWRGDLVEVHPDGWLVVFYEEPPRATTGGEWPAYGLRYHGTDQPLSILVSFNTTGHVLEYHCDAAFPATIRRRDIEFIDLDLDLVVAPDYTGYERDSDDFARNSRLMGYTDEAIATAHEGIRIARELLAARRTPFDDAPHMLLGRVLASQGPV